MSVKLRILALVLFSSLFYPAASAVAQVSPNDTYSVLEDGLGTSCVWAFSGYNANQTVPLAVGTVRYLHIRCYHTNTTWQAPDPAKWLSYSSGGSTFIFHPEPASGEAIAWAPTSVHDSDGFYEGLFTLRRVSGGSINIAHTGEPTSRIDWGGTSSGSIPNNNGVLPDWGGVGDDCLSRRVDWSVFGISFPKCRGGDAFDFRINPCDSLGTVWTPAGTQSLAAGETVTVEMSLGTPFEDFYLDNTDDTPFAGYRDLALWYRWGPSEVFKLITIPLLHGDFDGNFTSTYVAPRNTSTAAFEIRCSYIGDDFYYTPPNGPSGAIESGTDHGCASLIVTWPTEPDSGGVFDYTWRTELVMPAGADDVTNLFWRIDQEGATPTVEVEADVLLNPDGTVNSAPYPLEAGDRYTLSYGSDTLDDPSQFELRCVDALGEHILRQTWAAPDPGTEAEDGCIGASGIGLRPSSWVPGLVRMGSCVAKVLLIPDEGEVSDWATEQRELLAELPPFSFGVGLIDFGADLSAEVASPSGDACFSVGIPVAGVDDSQMCVGENMATSGGQRTLIAMFVVVPLVLGLLARGFQMLRSA